ncbi:MAG: hypothetical protein DRH11_17015 [Deltaproteobacteria bacterium]|nr:MAG: hypothetical protein DRH11_17015 [Deltaproteobacteria bacterium]
MLLSTLRYPTEDANNALGGRLFDHLHDTYSFPCMKRRTSRLPRRNRGAKHLPDAGHIGCKAVDAEEQGTTQCTPAHLLHQTGHQMVISRRTDYPSQPQSGSHLKRHRHPHDPPLTLHPKLVGLNLSQVAGTFHQMLMNLLTVLTRTTMPGGHRALIQTKRGNNRLHRTPVGQQRHDLRHKLSRIPQAIEHGPFALGEGLTANVADIPTLLATVDADVPTSHLAPGWTFLIPATYFMGIHC